MDGYIDIVTQSMGENNLYLALAFPLNDKGRQADIGMDLPGYVRTLSVAEKQPKQVCSVVQHHIITGEPDIFISHYASNL